MYRAHDIFCANNGFDDELKTEMMYDQMREEGLVDDYNRPTAKALALMNEEDEYDPEWEKFMQEQYEKMHQYDDDY